MKTLIFFGLYILVVLFVTKLLESQGAVIPDGAPSWILGLGFAAVNILGVYRRKVV